MVFAWARAWRWKAIHPSIKALRGVPLLLRGIKQNNCRNWKSKRSPLLLLGERYYHRRYFLCCESEMRQHNVTEGRKRWSRARERERQRARYRIRERVQTTDGIGDIPQNVDADDLACSFERDRCFDASALYTSEDKAVVSQHLVYIQQGDRSKFSIAFMDRNICLISSRHPTCYILDEPAIRDQTIHLSMAWFGKDYSCSLEMYIESLSTFTLMEYASWMGKFSIVSALILGGVNPCVRSYHKFDCQFHPKSLVASTKRTEQLGSAAVKRFFGFFPVRLSTYIVTRVVDMRRNATIFLTMHNDEHTNCAMMRCSVCDQFLPASCQLKFPLCGHRFCEICFWKDMLSAIDSDARTMVEDVVVCIICRKSNVPEIVYMGQQSISESNAFTFCLRNEVEGLDPTQRHRESLRRFNELPINQKALKNVGKKKKKATETNYLASSWQEAVLPSLGSTQDVRRDKFYAYIDRNSLPFIQACLVAGVDVNHRNEYGQTALFIAVWRGHKDLVVLLLDHGADPSIVAYGGSTIRSVCAACGYNDIMDLLGRHHALNFSIAPKDADSKELWSLALKKQQPFKFNCGDDGNITSLIPERSDHPGAGSVLIDELISSDAADVLLRLYNTIPIDPNQRQKKNSAVSSERSYFCDTEGVLQKLLLDGLSRVGFAAPESSTYNIVDVSTSCRQVAMVFPHMRFLHYSRPGAVLPPHVDLCRVNPFCIGGQKRSTHTFILYLSDCLMGGETRLLEDLTGQGPPKATVAPRRGRLLIFPHATPHEGLEVVDVPKVLLRGEIRLTKR